MLRAVSAARLTTIVFDFENHVEPTNLVLELIEQGLARYFRQSQKRDCLLGVPTFNSCVAGFVSVASVRGVVVLCGKLHAAWTELGQR